MTQESLFPMPQETRTSDDYWTPKWVFDALDLEFDLDVACPPEGPLHTPTKAWYTQETDGLVSPWHGRVWMNPPFSKANPWVRKFIEHRNGIALTVVGKSAWCDTLWNTADAIVLLPRSMTFEQGAIFLPTMLSAYGKECASALARVGKVR
jgi:phage N-6-adenine-methyltransferase